MHASIFLQVLTVVSAKRLAAICVSLLFTFLTPAVAFAQGGALMTTAGIQQNHDYFSGMPAENIDSKSGSLVLTFTDLVLPGNAGSELRVQRTYNSKTGTWSIGIPGLPMGARFNYYPLSASVYTHDRIITTSDGADHLARYRAPDDTACGNPNCRYYLTKEFWLMDTVGEKVYLSDGSVAEYLITNTQDRAGGLKKLTDAFGNVITLTQQNGEVVVRQYFEDKQTYREVSWRFPGTAQSPGYLRFSVNGQVREWRYEWTGSGDTQVMRAISPENTSWEYEYDNLPGASVFTQLTTVKTPSGGIIHYDFQEHDLGYNNNCPPQGADPSCAVSTPVVSGRQTSGSLPPGSWTFAYPPYNSPTQVSTITNPDGTVVELEYTSDQGAVDEYSSAVETHLKTRVVRKNGIEIDREERQYLNVPITTYDASGSAVLKSVKVKRDGVEYLTTHEYGSGSFGDYHRPWRTTESSPTGFTRITTREFQYAGFNLAANGQPRILGKVSKETVNVPGVQEPTYETSSVYDSKGFKTSETAFGRTTTFTRTAYGNVHTATNPNGPSHTTTYDYNWGIVTQIETPRHTTTRVINSDSTVQSETQAGRTTSFEYDKLLRIKKSTPPEGAEVLTDYATDAVTVTRGASKTRMALDGFGRVTETEIETGATTPKVRIETHYDAMGRKAEESLPFYQGGVKRFSTYTYDGLGRVTELKHPDNTTVATSYGIDPANGSVGIKNENGIWTVQNWKGFGSPDDARLVSVTDTYAFTWHYSYNALGKLVKVQAPDSVVRAWEYDGDLLKKETHPESGDTTYTYDLAGNLKTKKDGRQTTFTYSYDLNERLEGITAGSRVTAFTYEQGSDNRETAAVDGVSTTYAYDGAGRLFRRVDVVPGELPYSQEFRYDDRDNLQKVTYATNREVEFTYDAANRVTRVYDATRSQDYATTFAYHPSGALTSYKTSNNVTHEFAYDESRLWPSQIKVTNQSGTLWQLDYGQYDSVGNVRALADSRPNMGQSFEYDFLDRLKRAVGPYGEALYDYDANGNRKTNVAATYCYQSQRLIRQGSTACDQPVGSAQAFGYDENGNMTSVNTPSQTYTYTPDNQLATSNVLGVSAAYRYDADGWRIAKSSGGATSVYTRGANGQLMSEMRRTARRDYIYVGGKLIGMIFNKLPNSDPAIPTPPLAFFDPGLERYNFGFEAQALAPILKVTLSKALVNTTCTATAATGCTWGVVDTEMAPPNTTQWSNNTALTDAPPSNTLVLYKVTVYDVEDGIGTSPIIAVGSTDDDPDTFNFADATGAATGTLTTSNILAIHGISGTVAASISGGGSYRVCSDATCSTNPAFITGASSITNNSYLQLRVTSASAFSTAVSATMTVGTGSDTWSVTTAAQDTTPNAFTFTDQAPVSTSTVLTSNILPISGITGVVITSISGGGGAYRICGDATCSTNPSFISSASSIVSGQYLQLRLTSSSAYGTGVATTVTVGTASDNWAVTTQDITPNSFSFTNLGGLSPGQIIGSNVIQITGITGTVSTAIAGGLQWHRVCVDAGCSTYPAWSSNPLTITNGQYLQLANQASGAYGGTSSTTVTVGTVSSTWTLTTLDPCSGSPAVGTTCADGSKFAGYHPSTGTKMYVTPADYGYQPFAWPEADQGVTGWVDGRVNTNALANFGNYHAANACYYLSAHGKDDWYLPSPTEWNSIDPYRFAIGGFLEDSSLYWTSLESFYHYIGSDFNGYTGQGIWLAVRCMRRD
jgi:YD repeat-containing protein